MGRIELVELEDMIESQTTDTLARRRLIQHGRQGIP